MKNSNKPTPVLGVILMLGAAFFSLALILQVFNFGSLGPGQNNIFYSLGNLLISAYGITSSLIPLFLLIAGLSCFASKWTAKKSMILLTAVIPFFTSFGTEKLCKFILNSPEIEFSAIKIGVVAVIGFMLIIIEILLAGVFADKINSWIYGIPKKSENFEREFNQNEEKVSVTEKFHSIKDILENPEEKNSENQENIQNNAEFIQESENLQKNLNSNQNDEQILEEKTEIQKENPFENVFDDFNSKEDNKTETVQAQNITETADSTENKTEEAENFEEIDVADENEIDDSMTEENQGGLLTQEEYQALNSACEDEIFKDAEEEPADELEWPDTAEIKLRSGSTKPQEIIINRFDDEENLENSDEIQELEEINDEEENNSVKFEEFDDVSEADFDENTEEAENQENTENSEKIYSSNSLNPDFFDIDMNSEDSYSDSDLNQSNHENFDEEIKDFDEIIEENPSENENQQEFKNAEPVYEDYDDVVRSTPSILDDVFQDMEEDAQEEVGNIQVKMPKNTENSEGNQKNSENSVFSNNASAIQPTTVYEKPVISQNLQNKSSDEQKEPHFPPPLNRNRYVGLYKVPTDILGAYENDQYWIIDEQTKADSIKLKTTLDEFGISAQIIGIKKGPVVTMFELLPAPGVKLSKIVGLQDNIALSLAASSVRIVAPIPGKAAVGIEVPNKKRSIVSFREILEQKLPEFDKMAIPVILGKDILGKSQIIDIAKTPHLLIAGATGSGKSVCVNSLILSILYKRSPRNVKLMLIDPKVVELKLYNDIPHLLTPVITEPKKAIQALQYCIAEMERRYSLLDNMGVRDIIGYNKRIEERNIATDKLPYIVVIIDEFADLMATSGKELESDVARLTAKSRAAGIHLVLATQRPSVNVITGLIKANIPSRIAFMVTSRTDSNIIIDSVGAEKLLGKGDMLYASAVDPYPVRIQGTFETDQDVEKVVDYVKTLGEPNYIDEEIFIDDEDENDGQQNLFSEGDDPLYEQALDVVIQSGKASASYIQRRLRIGYNRAARLVEEMEERGIVGPANGSKPREIIHIPS